MKSVATASDPARVKQCVTCPWRVDCVPTRDIPNYRPEMHAALTNTIQSGLQSLFCKARHVMACHYSRSGEEFPCAGWLSNQIGAGNNIGLRVAVMTGQMPIPEVDGDQHDHFDDTLCVTRGAEGVEAMHVPVPQIKAVKDYARRGYASAASVRKPWKVYVGRDLLVDKRGVPRRFSTEAAAVAAARRSIA